MVRVGVGLGCTPHRDPGQPRETQPFSTKPRGHPLSSPRTRRRAGGHAHSAARCQAECTVPLDKCLSATEETDTALRLAASRGRHVQPNRGWQTPSVCKRGTGNTLASGASPSVTAAPLCLQRGGARAKSYTSGHGARPNRTVYGKPAGCAGPKGQGPPQHGAPGLTWAERVHCTHPLLPTCLHVLSASPGRAAHGAQVHWLLNGALKSQAPPKGSARFGNHSTGKDPSLPVTTEWAILPPSKDVLKHWQLIKKGGDRLNTCEMTQI